jgi:hypothetical protein
MKRWFFLLFVMLIGGRLCAAPVTREEAIRADLSDNLKLLEKYGSFENLAETIKPGVEENNRLARDKHAGKWVGDSFFSPGLMTIVASDFEEFKAATLRLHAFLRRRNIDLIVVRVPARQEVALPYFAGMAIEPGVSDPNFRRLERELLEAGVEYIDGLKPIQRNPPVYPLYYWYNVPGEGHPAEGALQSIAAEVARRLERYRLPRTGEYELIQIEDTFARGDIGHPYPAGNPKFDSDKLVQYSVLRDKDGNPPQIVEQNQSPLLFISDSYGAYTGGREKGGSMPHYVMARNGHLSDWMYRSASSEGAATFLARKGEEFLKGRQVVVLNAHPNRLKWSSCLPDDELLYLTPERLHTILRFDAKNWDGIHLTTPAGGDSILPDGALRLATVNPTIPNAARNYIGARMEFKLPPEAVKTYRAVAVQFKLRKHSYALWLVKSGKYRQRDFMSTSEKVPLLTIPIRLDGDTVTVELPSVQNEMIIEEIVVSGIDL